MGSGTLARSGQKQESQALKDQFKMQLKKSVS